ncbi:MAG: 1,4-dihydroxy-2-naphthoate octaprenyltransferase [Phocaeicola sp.]|uniref:1,4-dihydroxy-2-naphthoate octaprenyltransferase n=1 Tax=Phocaeicola sp. TaxID=2773926 RepID=UPI003FA04811
MEKRTLKDWIIATRPWSFPASFIPVLAIGAYLYYRYGTTSDVFHGWNLMLALPMMMLFQAGGNLLSDYSDYKKGVDLPGSLNGVRHIQSGKFTPKEIRLFGIILLSFAVLIGITLLFIAGFYLIWIGLAGMIMAFFYAYIKYHALGDLEILLCYALLPAIGTSYIALDNLHPEVIWICLPFGLLTVAILHANNTRDIQNDSRAKITTIPILIGGHISQWIYFFEVIIPYILIVLFIILKEIPLLSLITFLTIPMALKNLKQMMKANPNNEQELIGLDQTTAPLQLIFGILYTLSFVIMSLI